MNTQVLDKVINALGDPRVALKETNDKNVYSVEWGLYTKKAKLVIVHTLKHNLAYDYHYSVIQYAGLLEDEMYGWSPTSGQVVGDKNESFLYLLCELVANLFNI